MRCMLVCVMIGLKHGSVATVGQCVCCPPMFPPSVGWSGGEDSKGRHSPRSIPTEGWLQDCPSVREWVPHQRQTLLLPRSGQTWGCWCKRSYMHGWGGGVLAAVVGRYIVCSPPHTPYATCPVCVAMYVMCANRLCAPDPREGLWLPHLPQGRVCDEMDGSECHPHQSLPLCHRVPGHVWPSGHRSHWRKPGSWSTHVCAFHLVFPNMLLDPLKISISHANNYFFLSFALW